MLQMFRLVALRPIRRPLGETDAEIATAGAKLVNFYGIFSYENLKNFAWLFFTDSHFKFHLRVFK